MEIFSGVVMTMNERDVDELLAANDPLLRNLIVCEGEEERHAAVEAVLTDHIVPLVRRIVRRQQSSDRLLQTQDGEDITSNVILRLLRRLQRVPFDPESAVVSVSDFAATVTFNAIHDFQRDHFPEWTRLKNRVRYVLAQDPRFRKWTSAAGPACGLASWPEGDPVSPPQTWEHHDPARRAEAIESLLRAAGGPLLVDDVVGTLARVWKISDVRSEIAAAGIAAGGESHHEALEGRDRLAALWRETCLLPVQQRMALLLNLRDHDGGSALSLFPLMGIATLDEVAAALDVPLASLARLWSRLPLDDLTIASLLEVKRQKVINLRQAARQRLARRLRNW